MSLTDLPTRHFQCILADPPWQFKARKAVQLGNPGSERYVERHYSTMTVPEIMALPVRDIVAPDAHLFIWTTGPNLRKTFDVIEAWGFRYSAVAFTWVKFKRSFDAAQARFLPIADSDLHVGLGLTTRKNAEFCLLGRRGSARRNAKDVREIILAPVREHSRKPDEAATRIERYCDGPYLEMFARTPRPGWSSWGYETHKFEASA